MSQQGFELSQEKQRTSLVAQTVKHLLTTRKTWVRSLGEEDPLEKEMATLSSTLAWKNSRSQKVQREHAEVPQGRSPLQSEVMLTQRQQVPEGLHYHILVQGPLGRVQAFPLLRSEICEHILEGQLK